MFILSFFPGNSCRDFSEVSPTVKCSELVGIFSPLSSSGKSPVVFNGEDIVISKELGKFRCSTLSFGPSVTWQVLKNSCVQCSCPWTATFFNLFFWKKPVSAQAGLSDNWCCVCFRNLVSKGWIKTWVDGDCSVQSSELFRWKFFCTKYSNSKNSAKFPVLRSSKVYSCCPIFYLCKRMPHPINVPIISFMEGNRNNKVTWLWVNWFWCSEIEQVRSIFDKHKL